MSSKNTLNIDKETGRFGNWRASRDHPDYRIIKIGENNNKNPGYLKRLAVTQAPMKDNQQTLVGKTRKERNNNIK